VTSGAGNLFPAWADPKGAGESTLLTGLAHYYLLGEAAGATREDSVGDVDLTLWGEGTPTVPSGTGVNGNCIAFPADNAAWLADSDPQGDPVEAGGMQEMTSTWTVSFWISTTLAEGTYVWYNGPLISFLHVAGWPALTGTYEDIYSFTLAPVDTALIAVDGSWTHVVFAFDASKETPAEKLQIYLNGASKDLYGDNTYPTVCTPGGPFMFYNATEPYFVLSTSVDEFALWSRQLTSTEVAELYNSGTGKFYPFT